MATLQQHLASFLPKLPDLNEEERKQLSHLVDLNSRLAAASETAIDPKAIVGYVTSLAIPILSFLIGHFNIGSVFRATPR